MRWRWNLIFAAAITCLIGMSWLAARRGVSIAVIDLPHLGGIILAAVTGLVAALLDYPRRWPGWLALVGALPLAWEIFEFRRVLLDAIESRGLPLLLVVLGGVGTLACSIIALATPVPPPRAPPVPSAKVV
jgi:hypothetical protein